MTSTSSTAASWSGWQQPATWQAGQVAGYGGFAQQQAGYGTAATASQPQAGYATSQQAGFMAQPQAAYGTAQPQDAYAGAQQQVSYAAAAAAQQAGYMTAAQNQAGYAAQQAQPMAADEGVGNEAEIVVSGCTHPTVGSIVRGNFVLTAENHGKPAYRRDSQVNGLDVMIYYWDERDGPSFCGWWFGPRIGGDQVWAYHPSRNAQTPPTSGWKVPYDGAADPTLIISPKASQQSQSAQQGQQAWSGSNIFQRYQQTQQSTPQAQQTQQQQQQQFQAQGWQQQPAQAQQQYQQQQQAQAAQSQQQGFGTQQYNQQTSQQMAWYGQQTQQQQQQQPAQQTNAQFQQTAWQQPQQAQSAQQAQAYQYQQQLAAQQLALKQQQDEELRRQQQQQQLEMQRRMQEERQKKMEEANRRRLEEQRASVAIRRAIQKVRTAIPTTFEEARRELMEVLEKELAASGTQQPRLQEEADKALEQAQQRIEHIKEQQRRAEELRQEQERKMKEAQERAQQLLKELEGMVDAAEACAKELKQTASPLADTTELTVEQVAEAWAAVDGASGAAREKTKACTDFILLKNAEMKVAEIPGKLSETKLMLQKLLHRVNEATKSVEDTIKSSREAKDKAIRKAAAMQKVTLTKALFDKYDADKDQVLNRKEVLKYAKSEFNFTVPQATLDHIFKVLVEEGAKGIKREQFQQLKVAVGVARERVKDGERRAARIEREKKVAELKAELQQKVDEASKATAEAEELAGKAEQAAQPMAAKAAQLPATAMVELANEVEEKVKEAKEGGASAKSQIAALNEDVAPELKSWLTIEARQLDLKILRQEARLARVVNSCTKFREEARRKEIDELREMEREAVAMIKYHQRAKELDSDQLFEDIDNDKDGRIDKADFVSFFKRCEKDAEKAKPAKAGEDEAEQEEAQESAAKGPSDEDLQRLFTKYLDEENEGFITKERFLHLIRTYCKVTRDTVISNGIMIKDSSIRRVEVGEVVEVLGEPVKEETSGILRVRAKAMKDGTEGWVTLAGNQGSVFLEEGGNVFKVVRETILGDSFELDAAPKDGADKKGNDAVRKLKEGELLEVREWPRREEKSGLLRMKCRVRSDGAVGWVTTVSNQGTVFVEVL